MSDTRHNHPPEDDAQQLPRTLSRDKDKDKLSSKKQQRRQASHYKVPEPDFPTPDYDDLRYLATNMLH